MSDPEVGAQNGPRVAVVGAGYWGRNLVRVFYELQALQFICDKDPTTLAHYRQSYGSVAFEADFDALLKNSACDAVVLATPAETHYRMALRALLAGKDVFVEKPLALKPSEGEELVEVAERQGQMLMVGHVLLFHPAIQKLKESIDKGALGRIQYIYSNRLNLGKIRREENILWSFAPHDISVILMLLGETPKEVAAHGGCYLHSVVQDVTVSTLTFKSEVRAHLFVSWLHPYKEQKLVVVGDRQMAVFDDLEESAKLRFYPHQIEWVDRIPVPHRAAAQIIPVGSEEPLKEECRAFLQSVRSRRESLNGGRQSLEVLRILDACQCSLESGGRVVSIEDQKASASYFVHPTATIDNHAQIGRGTKIWHYSHVMRNAQIGENCTIGQNVLVASDVTIGNNVKIQNNVSVYSGVTLEDDVFCGPSAVFTNVNNPRSAVSRRDQYSPTKVQQNTTLKANCTIVYGNTIKRYAFIGAGAVVVKDVPDYAMVVGNPSRRIGWACECGIKLQVSENSAACPECRRCYTLKGDVLFPV